MKTFTAAKILAVLGLIQAGAAHMEMIDPPPFKSKHNPNAGSDIDYSMTSPLGIYPCKGYHSLLGSAAGASVATWAAGSTQSMTIAGGAAHNGGSCQASLSYDGGNTFKVIHSYIGNCPVNGESSYSFTVPSDAPSSEAIFAWTWFNKVGNREMYMNCAAVTITGGGSKAKRASFNSLPDIFVANVADTPCITKEGFDVVFPNGGEFITGSGGDGNGLEDSCQGASNPQPNPPVDDPEPPVQEPPVQEPTPTSTPPAVEVPPTPTPAPTKTSTIPGGVFIPNPTSSNAVDSPTTLSTSTRTAALQPSSSPNPPSTGEGLMTVGSACDSEGEWNCISGSSFQRCASGQWSQVINMAGGTTCVSGHSAQLTFEGKRSIRGIRGMRRA